MITAKLRQFKRVIGYRWYRFKMRHTHWCVTRSDGTGGFCVYGDTHAVTHFARNYLGNMDDIVVRRGWHRSDFTSHMRKMAGKYGLAVASGQSVPAQVEAEALNWPWLVPITISLPATVAEYRKKLGRSAQSDLRRINKQGFHLKITRAEARLKEFFHRYYLPSMLKKHGADAYLFTEKELMEMLGDGAFLVEVWREDEWVSGVLCKHDGFEMRMMRAGWRDADESIYRQGALSSMYWLTITWCIEQGLKRVNLGGVPPYLEDGLLAYKSKWGLSLNYELCGFNSWRVWVDPKHAACRAFFATHSVVVKNETAQRFEVVSGRAREAVPCAEIHAQIETWRRIDGGGAGE